MKLFAAIRHNLKATGRELRVRARLLAAAFARRLPSASPVAAMSQPQADLLSSLNLAGQAAGLQVWDWDLTTNTLQFDRNLMDRYDGDAQEAATNPEEFIARVVCPDDLAHYRREFVRAIKGEAPLCINYRVRQKDGSTHPVQLRGQVFRAPTVDGQLGRATRIVGFTIDMRSQLESAQRIEQQAQQLQQWIERIGLASETAGVGMWDWDLASGKLSSDTNMAGIFKDADLSSVVGATDFVAKILHPDDRESFVATMQAAVARQGGDRVSVNFRYLRSDGGVHHVELHGRIVRNEQGRAERFLGISWNITAKVEAQAEIERQSAAQQTLLERLNLATEVAGIDVWDWDLVTDRITADTRIANGYDSNHLEIQGGRQMITEVVHPEDLPGYLVAIDRALESGQNLIYRFRVVAPNGTRQHLQIHARVLRDADGKAIRLLGVSLDVTEEIKHLTELRRQADEERALRDRLNLATKTAGIGIWDKDLVGGAFVCDEQFWTIFGLTPDNRFKVHDGIHPSEREQALAPLNAAMADANRDEILAIRHRTSNPRHEPQFVQTHMRVFRDAGGKPIRLLGATWDVTNEVVHAEQLQRQADKERALIERLNITTKAAGISPWEIDIKTNCFSWHGPRPACFGMDHVPLAEYLEELTTIVLPEDRHLVVASGKEAVESNLNSYEYRFRVHGIDGKIHHMHNYIRVLRSERGNIRYLVGVTWDVTKEVEAAELLQNQAEHERALRERLNVATQAAGISPWEFDIKTGQYIWFGARLAVLGLDEQPVDTYYDALKNILVPEDRNNLHDAAVDAITNNVDVYSTQYRANGTDGQVHHLKNFVRVLRSPRGTPYRLIGVTWDVSEEVAAHELAQQQAEHERALVDRLNVSTQAAGISPWEFDLKTNQLTWLGIQLTVLGLNDVPLDRYMEALNNTILPEDRHILDTAATQALEGGVEVYSYRYRANGVDGQVHHMKNFVRILRSERGKPYRLVGVTWDVSEEVAASERLEAQVQHAQALKERLSIAAMAAGISPFEIDLTTGKFLWVENPLKSLAGMRGNDNALTTFSQRIHPDDINLFRDEIVRAAKGGYDIVTYRYRAIANDDSIVHVKTYAKLYFDEKRRAIRALGVSWDATRDVEAAARLQVQAEHERKLLERLNIATESAGISSWEIDLLAAKFLWIENPLKSIQHNDDDDLELAQFTARVLPEDRSLMPQAIRASLATKSDHIGFRYRAIGNDDKIVHVQTFARLIVHEDGRPLRILGVSWDVTSEVVAAEQLGHQTDRLREAERRLERASLSSSEGHWEAELATSQLWCSSSFHTLLGYKEGELPTRVSALDYLVHADDRAQYHTALHNHLVNNELYDVETRMRMASGEYRWFRMRGMAERDAHGQPTVMAGSIHDVHQQKLVEDALTLAQRRFERAINGTQDGLWELEIDSNTMWCSPRLALLLGYSVSQLATNNFLRTLMHPEEAGALAKVTESHYRHNTPFDVEVRMKTSNGEYRWYRARATADRDSNGRAIRLSGSLQEVTEARAAHEELVRATEAAEAASRAKSTFLANVSHEIRTPMNGIIGMTGLLIDTQLDRTQRDYANTIRGSADSLLTVINDILDFSKIEAGKLDLENIELDLRANVEDVGAAMAFQAASKGLELIINVHPEVPEYVLGDPQRLRQCLINLVGNAIKFTKHGEIVVDVCAVGRHEGRVLTHFEVRDTGMGIPDATLKTLFQPFVQADSSTTRHFGGTGLGLSIVRRLVEMMGGQVGVVSELGKGSNFFFTLSLEPKDDVTPMPLQRSVKGGRILIVDDNATNCRVLASLLTHQGYRVMQAESGAAALQQLQSGQMADMVITDFQMPDMDGLTLGERIMSDPSLTHLRLVMLTSLDRQGDSKHLAALGFAAYLTKPVRTRELLDCVAHVLSGEARQWQMEMRPMITHSTLSQAMAQQRFAGRVLLVEDNLVNQKVAARFLERMGCTVRIADHGAESVAAFQEESFDLVLMDLQMPVMDGLVAARTIRELESEDPSRRRTPIVALTANAMRGDQERCEAAGMDGYLTKPIEIERLRDALTKFGLAAPEKPGRSANVDELDETAQHAETPPIHLARLNEITDGDQEFAKELIETFIVSGEQQLAEIHAAIGALDRDALARAAHKIKGACANIHAEALCTLATRLEADAFTANEVDLQTCDAQLQTEFARAKEFLNDPSVMPAAVRAAS